MLHYTLCITCELRTREFKTTPHNAVSSLYSKPRASLILPQMWKEGKRSLHDAGCDHFLNGTESDAFWKDMFIRVLWCRDSLASLTAKANLKAYRAYRSTTNEIRGFFKGTMNQEEEKTFQTDMTMLWLVGKEFANYDRIIQNVCFQYDVLPDLSKSLWSVCYWNM